VLFAVKNETLERHVCFVHCRVRLYTRICVLFSVQSETLERHVCFVQCRVGLLSGIWDVCGADWDCRAACVSVFVCIVLCREKL